MTKENTKFIQSEPVFLEGELPDIEPLPEAKKNHLGDALGYLMISGIIIVGTLLVGAVIGVAWKLLLFVWG